MEKTPRYKAHFAREFGWCSQKEAEFVLELITVTIIRKMTDALCHLVVDGNDVMDLKLGMRRIVLLNNKPSMSVLFMLTFISVRSPKEIEDDTNCFNPEMCHQVFGDNENIFGYTDLEIKLYYTAGSLQTYLGIVYTDKVS